MSQQIFASVNFRKWVGVGLVAVVVLILLISAGYFMRAKNKLNFDSSDFQAVFLSNGQVYFGKISDQRDQFIELSNIYYLQLKQPLQNQGQDVLNQPDLTLIKLGNELHGPVDEMKINRDHVLFIENLRSDSKVTQAIEQFRANK
jgi:hypothetical protein